MKIFKKTATLILAAAVLLCGCSITNDKEEIPETTDTVQESVSSEISAPESTESVPPAPKETREDFIARINDYDSKYFVKKLNDNLLKYFSIIYLNVVNFNNDIDFGTKIKASDLDNMMYLLNYDCPELIHLTGDYMPKYVDEEQQTVSGVRLWFIMDKEFYNTAVKQLDDFITDLQEKVKDQNELQRELYIYDYLFNNTIYNETELYSGSIYGTIINHKGRCEGLCKSFMWCMRKLGNECLCVSGMPKWETTSVYSSHSWNIVKIDSEYYHLDITVDNMNAAEGEHNPPTYGFFNVTDSFVLESRTIEKTYTDLGIPACTDESKNYHIRKGLIIRKTDDIKTAFFNMLRRKFKENSFDNITIKFDDTENYNNVVQNINEYLKEFFAKYSITGYTYTTYCNQLSRTMVLYCDAESLQLQEDSQAVITDEPISDDNIEPVEESTDIPPDEQQEQVDNNEMLPSENWEQQE